MHAALCDHIATLSQTTCTDVSGHMANIKICKHGLTCALPRYFLIGDAILILPTNTIYASHAASRLIFDDYVYTTSPFARVTIQGTHPVQHQQYLLQCNHNTIHSIAHGTPIARPTLPHLDTPQAGDRPPPRVPHSP
jgi:hypothetical protein